MIAPAWIAAGSKKQYEDPVVSEHLSKPADGVGLSGNRAQSYGSVSTAPSRSSRWCGR